MLLIFQPFRDRASAVASEAQPPRLSIHEIHSVEQPHPAQAPPDEDRRRRRGQEQALVGGFADQEKGQEQGMASTQIF